jgi:hypothetical protein
MKTRAESTRHLWGDCASTEGVDQVMVKQYNLRKWVIMIQVAETTLKKGLKVQK